MTNEELIEHGRNSGARTANLLAEALVVSEHEKHLALAWLAIAVDPDPSAWTNGIASLYSDEHPPRKSEWDSIWLVITAEIARLQGIGR
jgi:hypothetical protein